MLGALLVLGCGEDATGPRPVPIAMAIAAGDGQQGTVGQPLDSALTVFVTDKFGQPVPGVLVRFATPGRSGSLTPIAQTTGPGGHASARWTMPTNTGDHLATATASGLDSLVFHASAAPSAPAAVSLVTGNLQAASVMSALAGAVVVQIRDTYGNAVSGAPVAFLPTEGSGSVVPTATRSDSGGRAQTSWILGETPGLHALLVRVDSLPPLRVQAHALTRVSLAGFGVTLYSASADWAGAGSGGSDGGADAGRVSHTPISALRCWRNALGPAPLEGDPGDWPRATDGMPDDGARCEEPTAF